MTGLILMYDIGAAFAARILQAKEGTWILTGLR